MQTNTQCLPPLVYSIHIGVCRIPLISLSLATNSPNRQPFLACFNMNFTILCSQQQLQMSKQMYQTRKCEHRLLESRIA